MPRDLDKRPTPPNEGASAREIAAAGNALVEWFNTQELPPALAEKIMSKVIAKLLIAKLPKPYFQADIHRIVDAFELQLVHDLNDRLHAIRRN